MKKYILVDNLWELKRYKSSLGKRWIVEIDPGDPLKLSRLQSFLFSYQLIEKPIVFIESVEKWNKEDLKWLVEALKKSEADVVVSSSHSEILKKFGKFEDLSVPKPWETEKWIGKIKEISKYHSTTINTDAALELLKRVGTDLDLISKEIEKLSVISDHPSLEDVQEMVPLYSKPNLFEFIYLTLSKNDRALEFLKEILIDTHPLIVVKNLENSGVLLTQLILIGRKDHSWNDIKDVSKRLQVKTSQIADLVGFSIGNKKRKNLLKVIKFGDMIHFLEELQDVEVKIKNGGDSKFLLLNFVKEWIQGKKERDLNVYE